MRGRQLRVSVDSRFLGFHLLSPPLCGHLSSSGTSAKKASNTGVVDSKGGIPEADPGDIKAPGGGGAPPQLERLSSLWFLPSNPKTIQEAPQTASNRSKTPSMSSRRFQRPPRRPKKAPRGLPGGSRRQQSSKSCRKYVCTNRDACIIHTCLHIYTHLRTRPRTAIRTRVRYILCKLMCVTRLGTSRSWKIPNAVAARDRGSACGPTRTTPVTGCTRKRCVLTDSARPFVGPIHDEEGTGEEKKEWRRMR